MEERDPAEEAAAYLKNVLGEMGLSQASVEIQREEAGAALTLSGDDIGFIIGHRGETLDALQYLASLVANHVDGTYYRITLDVGNYREKRKETLEALGKKMAARAVKTGRNSSLEPMNPYERRIIHTAVQTVAGAKSWSEGVDQGRHVVIGPEGGERPQPRRSDRDAAGTGAETTGTEAARAAITTETAVPAATVPGPIPRPGRRDPRPTIPTPPFTGGSKRNKNVWGGQQAAPFFTIFSISVEKRKAFMEKTIAAVSTAPAPGGIGIVRISGEEAFAVADQVFRGVSGKKLSQMRGYTAQLGGAFTPAGERLDDVVALVYRSPKSYTGEDVVELSCHGGLYVTKRLLQLVLDAGASPAGPGEFTRRAFLNGKMDLAQAEAVMGLISASGEQARKAALAGSSGVLSQRIAAIKGELMEQAAHLAAWADFPEEDVPEVEESQLLEGIRRGEAALSQLLEGFERGRMYREGLVTVIAGRPNAGKSTLMNLLSGCQRSIVTQYAGTTRDVVEETVMLAGVPLRLADTAGLRDTDDPVESIGVRAARQRLETAQLVLAVFDSSQALEKEDRELMDALEGVPSIAIVNKTDLPSQIAVEEIQARFEKTVFLSAATGEGLEDLEQSLSEILDTKEFYPQEGVLFTQRQRADAQTALDSLREGEQALLGGLTLDAVTVCVEDALTALSALTGEHVSEEIVDRVFEEFCVGK